MRKSNLILSWSELLEYTKTNKKISIGKNIIVEPNVSFVMQSHKLDCSLTICDDVHIMTHCVIYHDTYLGQGVTVAHSALIREFCNISSDVVIGARSEIQERVNIGRGSRLNSNVLISGGSVIGSNCWIFPNVVITNDPNPPSHIRAPVEIKDFAVVAVGAMIMPGVTIGANSFVGPGSVVTQSVPDGMCMIDSEIRGPAHNLRMYNDFNMRAYPWTERYP